MFRSLEAVLMPADRLRLKSICVYFVCDLTNICTTHYMVKILIYCVLVFRQFACVTGKCWFSEFQGDYWYRNGYKRWDETSKLCSDSFDHRFLSGSLGVSHFPHVVAISTVPDAANHPLSVELQVCRLRRCYLLTDASCKCYPDLSRSFYHYIVKKNRACYLRQIRFVLDEVICQGHLATGMNMASSEATLKIRIKYSPSLG